MMSFINTADFMCARSDWIMHNADHRRHPQIISVWSRLMLSSVDSTLKRTACSGSKLEVVQAKSELGTTKRRNLSHVIFLDQNLMRNKNILGKKPKS